MSSLYQKTTTKDNTVKIKWLLLIMVSIVVLIVGVAAKTTLGKVENTTNPVIPEISANNVTMKLISAHTEGSGSYRVELCYDLPDQRDWLLTYSNTFSNTTLSFADVKVHPIEEGTMYWKYDENGRITQRCEYLLFAVKIPSQNKNLSLRIGYLYAKEPGQPDYCLETSQKMVERNYPVTIDCMKINGFENMVYVKLPFELLSIDPVFKNIFKDVKWDFYNGPWSFTFPVNPP